MEGVSITGCIIKNKDKIKFIEKVDTSTSSYWLFKLYFNKRNIFGFRKYIKIISYTEPSDWLFKHNKDKNFGFDIEIEIPTWNPFTCDNYVQIEPAWNLFESNQDNRKLSEILYDVWYRGTYTEENVRWQKLGKVLYKNLKK